jgi:hypothetical protein
MRQNFGNGEWKEGIGMVRICHHTISFVSLPKLVGVVFILHKPFSIVIFSLAIFLENGYRVRVTPLV